MIEIRLATPADSNLVAKWYEARGFEDPRPSLPHLGAVAVLHGGPVAILYAYQFLGTTVAMLDWMTTAPGLSPRITRAALSLLLERLDFELRCRNVKTVLVQFTNSTLAAEATQLGFQVVGVNAINMAKQL